MADSGTKWLVVTDLDGTLLHHDTYQLEPADKMISRLHDAGIPVIFNTSKTWAETTTLQQSYELEDPFIVETGSCIFLPVSLFPDRPDGAVLRDDYWKVQLGISHREISLILDSIDIPDSCYTRFSRCSIEQIIDMTGLSSDQAKQAIFREFSEPVIWHADEKELDIFRQRLSQHHLTTIHGGRFLHVLGTCDKGTAARRLAACYSADTKIIALGDSVNDTSMLNIADIPIIVNSPSSDGLQQMVPAGITTEMPAPDGWCEGINKALAMITQVKE